MPTYVYACDSCGVQFEQIQPFNDPPLRVCPQGHEGSVRRVFQPVGIVFKGSGWYITDSRKSDSAGIQSGDTKAETKDSTEKTSAEPSESSSEKPSVAPEKASSEATSSKPADTSPPAAP